MRESAQKNIHRYFGVNFLKRHLKKNIGGIWKKQLSPILNKTGE